MAQRGIKTPALFSEAAADHHPLRRSLARLAPRSFLGLLLAGFLTVSVPLVAALVNTSFEVSRLARDSQQAIQQAMTATNQARAVVDELDDVERAARQYLVLQSSELWNAYERRQNTLIAAADGLAASMPRLADDARAIQLRSSDLQARIAAGNAERAAITAEFADVAAAAVALYRTSTELASAEADEVRVRAEGTQRLLMIQAIAIIAAALLLVFMFLRIISKPVREIDAAIRSLGDGRLDREIVVTGPQDFAELGVRLDWLRVRLGELDEQKSRFLRHVSHELKTPMSAIREGSNLLLDEVPGPLLRPQREVTEIVRDNARRLEHLINDVLAITRLPTGLNYHDDWQSVDLGETVRTVLQNHALPLAAKAVQLDADIASVQVRGSANALMTIVDNLVSNAVKYAPARGHVRVSLRREHGTAVLDVEDNGSGIDMIERDVIFEPFFRSTKHAAVKGSGLGLTIAKEAAQAHRGQIAVVDGQGTGACLRLTLPIADS